MSFSEWKKYKVGEFCETISKTHKFQNGKVVFLNTGDIEKGKFLHKTFSSPEGLPGQAKKSIQKGDILLSEIRPANGRYAFVDFDAEDYVVSTKLMVIRAKENISPRYLYHFLTNSETTRTLQHLAESRSGTFPQITFTQVQDLEILVPELKTQKQIASFIDSIDDTVNINQQINKTLEEMAKAIFKEWFVDFNFPNATGKFQETEIGKIPVGWKVGKLGDVVETKGGTTPSTTKKEYWDGEYYWTSPRDLSNLQTNVLLDTSKKITALGLKQISSGILPKGTLLLSSRAPIGYLAISEVPISINQGFIAINGTKVSNLFMMYWIKQNMDVIISNANGSTFLEISKTVFRNIPIAIPSKEVLENFEEIISGIYNQILNNEKENQSLMNLRDTLLPKLMKGEIEINSKADVAKV